MNNHPMSSLRSWACVGPDVCISAVDGLGSGRHCQVFVTGQVNHGKEKGYRAGL